MSKQWEKDIHDQLKDFRQKAPEGLLDDIKSKMPRHDWSMYAISPSKAPHPSNILRYASVMAAMIFFALKLNLYTCTTLSFEEKVLSTTNTKQTDETISIAIAPSLPIRKNSKETSHIFTDETHLSTKEYTTEKQRTQTTEEENIQQLQPEKRPEKKQGTILPYQSLRRPSSFSISAHFSGMIAQNTAKEPQEMFPLHDTGNTTGSSPFVQARFEEKETHHLPIKAGISFRYSLNDRWHIQSGLTYSYLSSDISKSDGYIAYDTKQKLHYIGIPLQLGYQIWTNNRFKVYASTGGQAEKLVKGIATTSYSINNKHQSTSTETLSDNRLLFSALASLGLEYIFGKDFSLYAEPGIHYYFKNGNSLKTHYHEQPLNFNITIGFRFHWDK